ncbi:MAG: hypothetical protein KF780_02755 [Sphingomonas sp.]|nr:hypothetical protein [Sphingomonas sp.]
MTILSASTLAISPIAVSAATPLSVANANMRAGAVTTDSSQLNGGVGIGLGLLIFVAIIAIAVSSDSEGGTPTSP